MPGGCVRFCARRYRFLLLAIMIACGVLTTMSLGRLETIPRDVKGKEQPPVAAPTIRGDFALENKNHTDLENLHCPIGEFECPCAKDRGCLSELECVGTPGVCKLRMGEPLTLMNDMRPKQCLEPERAFFKAENVAKYRSTSVVMCFHNEDAPSLNMSIRSLLHRTSPKLLVEILLVDDQNENIPGVDVLHFPKVRMIRTPSRLGIAGCRMFGADYSVGDVIVFLDAHVEAGFGWLEPLQWTLLNKPNTLATPIVENLKPDSRQWMPAGKPCGGLNFKTFHFEWTKTPKPCALLFERDRKEAGMNESDIAKETLAMHWADSYPSPTGPGGLYAVNREWWYKSGTYDEGMKIWGAENIEQAIRVWSCGGRIDIVPCSHVGHVYRTSGQGFRFKFPKQKGTHQTWKNTARAVAAWVEYPYLPVVKKLISHVKWDTDVGDISARLQLKKDLQCHNFKWFVQNIFPDLHVQFRAAIAPKTTSPKATPAGKSPMAWHKASKAHPGKSSAQS